MAKHIIVKVGLAASLCLAALPLAANAVTQVNSQTEVRIAVTTSVSCQSAGNYGTDNIDVQMGELVPGTGTTAPTSFTMTGTTNSLSGFTITGTPTALINGTGATAPRFTYKYGDTTPDTAYWWLTTTESEVGAVSIGQTVVLTSSTPIRAFNLGANAQSMGDTPAGDYVGYINWVCTVQ